MGCKKGSVIGVLLGIVLVVGFTGDLAAVETEGTVLEEVVVTATRDWEQERKVPYNVTVITEEEIKQTNAQNVADLLRTVPGLYVADWTANRKSVTVDVRGFGETGPLNTLVLVDGRRANEIDLSGTDWMQIPLDQVERIEVIKGGGSVLYGDNAVGGVVNIITKKGEGKPTAQAEALGGSDGLNIERASSLGELAGVRYTIHARRENTRGFRHNGDYEGYDFGASAGYDIGDLIKLDISGNYHRDRYGLPGALSHQDLHTWADREDTKNPDDKGATQDFFLKFTGELDLKAWGRFVTDISYRRRWNEAEFHYIDSWFLLPGCWEPEYEIPTFAVNPKWIWEKELWELHNKLIFGFDYYYTDSDLETYDPHPIFGGDPTKGYLIQYGDIQRQTWGIYLHDDFSPLNNLILSLGYRYEGLEDRFKGGSWIGLWQYFRDEKDDYMHAWEVGLTYLYWKGSKVYARIASSYRYPAIDEYFSLWSGLNRRLDPQEGINYEIGVDHHFTDRIRSGLTFFWMELEDEIYYNPLTYTNENYDDTRRWGFEVFAEASPWTWLRLWANYTFIKATFRGGVYEDNDVPGVPHHKASFGFGLKPPFSMLEGLELHVWGNYVGERHFISDQPNVVPRLGDYLTLNAKLSYTWRFLTAFVGVNNLFDEEYSEYGVCNPATGARNYYPAAGINFQAGLNVRF